MLVLWKQGHGSSKALTASTCGLISVETLWDPIKVSGLRVLWDELANPDTMTEMIARTTTIMRGESFLCPNPITVSYPRRINSYTYLLHVAPSNAFLKIIFKCKRLVR